MDDFFIADFTLSLWRYVSIDIVGCAENGAPKQYEGVITMKRYLAKLSAIALTVMMLTVFVPMGSFAADIQMVADTPTLTVNSTIRTIGFAGQEWYVIGYNGTGVYTTIGDTNSVTLFVKGGSPYGTTQFHSTSSNYSGSTLQSYILGSNVLGTIPAKEQSLITARVIGMNGIGGGSIDVGQPLWPLSSDEWNVINNSTVCRYGNGWWMRSSYTSSQAFAGADIGVNFGPVSVDNNFAARPALNLNLASVLFTSAASGTNGKSAATVGSDLTSAIAPTGGKIKFTAQSTLQTLNVIATTAQSKQSVPTTGSLAFSYANATTGTNQNVSCVLVNGSSVTYYGKLMNSSSAASGTLSIPLTGVANGTYTLRIFSEEANGENLTDFCSTPVDMTLTVDGGYGVVSNFSGTVLSDNAGLTSVAGQPITAGGETGTSTAPKTANISVANSVASVALSDITASDSNATVALYSNSGFGATASPISLTAGAGTDLYIKVTAEDGTILYYKVTVARAAPTYAIGFTTNGVTANGVTATGQVSPASPQAAGAGITVTVTLTGTATAAGTHTVGLTSASAGAITPPAVVAKTVAASESMAALNTFAFTFNMPASAVSDLVVAHTYSATPPTTFTFTSNFPTVTNNTVAVSGTIGVADYVSDFGSGTGSSVVIKGVTLTDGTHYTHASGSVVITLLPAYLSTLGNGSYPVVVNFAGGGTATTTLTVALSGAITPAGTTGSSGATGNPKTADNTPLGLLITLMAVAGVGVTLGIRRRFIKN